MIGQINLNTAAGDAILRIASQDDILSIVEIGTWNGAGSTRCVIEGIKNKPEAIFYSLECDKQQYDQALSNVSPQNNVNLILGKIVEADELDVANLIGDEPLYLKNDLNAMADVPNVLDQLPLEIDFLILDGGEFSTIAELDKLIERTKYIFLDDTNPRKNRENRIRLFNSSEFIMLEDHSHDRHGWSLFKREA
jgi:hypothetical protein